MAGGNDEVYDALIEQIFDRFASDLGYSYETSYDWRHPYYMVKGKLNSTEVCI